MRKPSKKVMMVLVALLLVCGIYYIVYIDDSILPPQNVEISCWYCQGTIASSEILEVPEGTTCEEAAEYGDNNPYYTNQPDCNQPEVTCWRCNEENPESQAFPYGTICGEGAASGWPYTTQPNCENPPDGNYDDFTEDDPWGFLLKNSDNIIITNVRRDAVGGGIWKTIIPQPTFTHYFDVRITSPSEQKESLLGAWALNIDTPKTYQAMADADTGITINIQAKSYEATYPGPWFRVHIMNHEIGGGNNQMDIQEEQEHFFGYNDWQYYTLVRDATSLTLTLHSDPGRNVFVGEITIPLVTTTEYDILQAYFFRESDIGVNNIISGEIKNHVWS